MNDLQSILERQGIQAEPVHVEATAAIVSALLRGTAERFAALPLEAEPSGFQAEQARGAP